MENKWQVIDDEIQSSFQREVREIKASEEMKWKIDQEIRRSHLKGKKNMRRWCVNKKVVVAIATALFISTACFAGGQAVSIIGTGHPDWLCYSYEKREKAEKKLGFDIQIVKEFSNGYTIKNIDVQDNKEIDKDDNTVGKFKSASITYTKEDQGKIYVDVEKTRACSDTREPNETREYGDITLNYYLSHYKFVPTDYELTLEDKANMEKEDYEISVGSDEVEESDVYSIHFEIGDISYSLMQFDTKMTVDELFDMAEEIIDTKEENDLLEK